jgi:hypothetical protein
VRGGTRRNRGAGQLTLHGAGFKAFDLDRGGAGREQQQRRPRRSAEHQQA